MSFTLDLNIITHRTLVTRLRALKAAGFILTHIQSGLIVKI